jgi:hypothetical protein
VGRTDAIVVGHIYVDAIVCGCDVVAWCMDVQEVSCTSGVGYGQFRWFWAGTTETVGFRAMISWCHSWPCLSGDKGFVAVATTHGVGAGGFSLISWCRALPILAVCTTTGIPVSSKTDNLLKCRRQV